MKENREKMIDKGLLKKINFIEIYQIIGGVLGLTIIFYLFLTTNLSEMDSFNDYFTLICSLLFFGFCIYSGVLLNKKEYSQGLKLVIISLIFQLFSFQFSNIVFTAISGIGINLKFDITNDFIVGFDFFPSHFLLLVNSSQDFFLVRINLIAIAMLFYVLNTIKMVNLYTDKI